MDGRKSPVPSRGLAIQVHTEVLVHVTSQCVKGLVEELVGSRGDARIRRPKEGSVTVGEITWFETACANNLPVQTTKVRHFYCYSDWWMIMQRHGTSVLIPQQIRSRTFFVTHLIISDIFCSWEKIHYTTWRGQLFALCCNQSEFIKFTTAGWMIGSDISLTFFLLNFRFMQ